MIKIRNAVASDAKTISELAMKSKASWGYDDDFMEACRSDLTFDATFIQDNLVFIAEYNEQSAAFSSLSKVNKEELELSTLFVHPDFMRKKIGRALVLHSIEKAKRLNYKKMGIQADPHAEAFYQSVSAVKVGETESTCIPNRMLPFYEIDLWKDEK